MFYLYLIIMTICFSPVVLVIIAVAVDVVVWRWLFAVRCSSFVVVLHCLRFQRIVPHATCRFPLVILLLKNHCNMNVAAVLLFAGCP